MLPISKTLLRLKAFLLLCVAASPAISASIIIHTGDPGTSSTGRWYRASGASMPIEGNKGMYSNVNSSINTYTFETRVPETNTYTIQTYNTCYNPRSHNTLHTLVTGSASRELVLDQHCRTDPYVGQWRTLGTASLAAGETVSLTISTEGSDNRYVGAAAMRLVYDELGTTPVNTPPTLSVSNNSFTVNQGDTITINATAFDAEDGDISSSVSWYSSQQQGIGNSFTVTAQDSDFVIQASVTDSNGAESNTALISVTVNTPSNSLSFDFGCVLTPLINSSGLQNYNASALPNVGSLCGKYTAQVTENDNNKTLFFNGYQGRLDGVSVRYPFEAILRNVGIAPPNQPNAAHVTEGNAYNFVGLHIHHVDFDNVNSSHLVVGQRGRTINTIEGKMTRYGSSGVNDTGNNTLPNGRADIRLVMDGSGDITAYWQLPNLSLNKHEDNWTPYRGTGVLPGTKPEWGNSGQVIVGIITYSYHDEGVPFWGVAERLEINEL